MQARVFTPDLARPSAPPFDTSTPTKTVQRTEACNCLEEFLRNVLLCFHPFKSTEVPH